MIIHFHFHFLTTGVTRSVESVLETLNLKEDTRVFGYGISKYKISLIELLKNISYNQNTIVHTHRNNETLFALILRFFGGKFKLITTRHAESIPSKATDYLISKADQLISLSQKMAETLKSESKIIGHGIDTHHFYYDPKKRTANSLKIIVVGRIRNAKGQKEVMEAIAPLLFQNPNLTLQFIGTVESPKYAEEIKSIASESGVENQIFFVPQTSKIEEYYQESSVVVIASHSEGFSLVCLEAMASGCITIATEHVGIHSDVILNGINGFLFTKKSSIKLRKLLEEVFENPEELNPEVIRKTIVDNWSLTLATQKLFDLYNDTRKIM